MNLTVIISDVDTVWMRNPFEYMKRYPEADILTSSDHLTWTSTDEGLEDVLRAGSAFNIGIMMFSPKALEFAKEWVAVIEADDNIWDQNAFNECASRLLLCVLFVLKSCEPGGSISSQPKMRVEWGLWYIGVTGAVFTPVCAFDPTCSSYLLI